jgi:hypothetical protein
MLLTLVQPLNIPRAKTLDAERGGGVVFNFATNKNMLAIPAYKMKVHVKLLGWFLYSTS